MVSAWPLCGAQIISLKLDMVSLNTAHKEAGAAADAAPDSVAAVNREVLRQVRTGCGGAGTQVFLGT